MPLRSNPDFQALQKKVLGYGNYMNISQRKETDESIRISLGELVSSLSDAIKALQEAAIMSQMTMLWPELEALVRAFDSIPKELSETNYGSTTFFDSPELPEFDLNLLVALELGTFDLLEGTREKIEAFSEALELGMLSDSSQLTGDLLEAVGQASQRWEQRTTLIREYKGY